MIRVTAGATERLDKPSKKITNPGTRAIVEDMEKRGLILEIKPARPEHSECGPHEKQEQNQSSSPPR